LSQKVKKFYGEGADPGPNHIVEGDTPAKTPSPSAPRPILANLSSIDLFLFYRTDYTDSGTMLNGCTGKCVRLSRPLVGF